MALAYHRLGLVRGVPVSRHPARAHEPREVGASTRSAPAVLTCTSKPSVWPGAARSAARVDYDKSRRGRRMRRRVKSLASTTPLRSGGLREGEGKGLTRIQERRPPLRIPKERGHWRAGGHTAWPSRTGRYSLVACAPVLVGDVLVGALAGGHGGDHGARIGKVCRTFTRRGSARALRSASSWHAARNASMAPTMSLTNDAIPMSTRCG